MSISIERFLNNEESKIRILTFRWMMIFIAFAWPITYLNIRKGHPEESTVLACFATLEILTVFIIFLSYHKKLQKLAPSLFLILGLISIVIMALTYGGGLGSPSLKWIAFVPIVAAFFINIYASLVFGILSLIAAAIIHKFSFQPLQPIAFDVFSSITYITIILGTIFGYLYELSKRKSLIEITDALHAKQNYLTTLSHEIRTPLTSLLGMLELTKNTELNPNQKKYIATAVKSGEILLNLVNGALDLSKIESGSFQVECRAFRLSHILKEVDNFFKAKCDNKKIKLSIDNRLNALDNFNSEPILLQQILINLITNAINHTNSGEIKIKIQVMPAEFSRRGNTLFSVEDTGTGVPESSQNMIFQKFYQAHQNTTVRSGTGIGLSISQAFVEALGGEIWHEPNQPTGSRFLFTINLDPIQSEAPDANKTSSDSSSKSITKLRILMAEDNLDNQFLITEYLKDEVANLVCAADGEEAIALYQRSPQDFDIILMDLQMPNVDGYKAIKTIRKWELSQGIRAIPILAFSAHAQNDNSEELKTGLHDCGFRF